MNRIAVYTPTARPGGLDVTASCLRQQTTDSDIVWIIGDEIMDQRADVVEQMTQDLDVIHFDTAEITRSIPGYYTSHARSYNVAVDRALALCADLFVIVQDYIWIPPDGLSRFESDVWLEPRGLFSGICHHSVRPTKDEIADPDGLWTIFDQPWDGRKPEGESWHDVRLDETKASALYEADPGWWETNWAAIPMPVLEQHPQLRWPPEYDVGFAYENQYVSLSAAAASVPTWLDSGNVAISLPHKSYFPVRANNNWKKLNAKMHHERFGIPMAQDMLESLDKELDEL